MSNDKFYEWPNWPKTADIPLSGVLAIYDSGGQAAAPVNYLSIKIETLPQEALLIVRQLISNFLLMDLSDFSAEEGAKSHCLIVGQSSFDAQPLALPQLRIREEEDDYRVSGPPDENGHYCPDAILHLYTFIKDPESYTKAFTENEGLPEPDTGKGLHRS